MPRLLSLPAITTAIVSTTSPVYQTSHAALDLTLQATFTFGSGVGTTCNCFAQTSIDGGSHWVDVASFSFGTASESYIFNLSSETPVTSQYTPTDGTLAANTCVDGILGNLFRCKFSTTGTYGGNTSLAVDAISSSRMELL
jgi:hypothetical protein